MSKKICGVLTAIVTPFDNEGALNLTELKNQVNRQLNAGNGIFLRRHQWRVFLYLTRKKKKR